MVNPTSGYVGVPVGARPGPRIGELIGKHSRDRLGVSREHEAAVGAVVVSEIMVDFTRVVVLGQSVGSAVDKVVPRRAAEVAGLVRRRVKVGDLLPQRINAALRNDVAGEGIAGQRIPHRDIGAVGEVSAYFREMRHIVARVDDTVAPAAAFVVEEEEGLVFRDRPADGGAENVVTQRRFFARKKPAGVNLLIAEELIGGAVKIIKGVS